MIHVENITAANMPDMTCNASQGSVHIDPQGYVKPCCVFAIEGDVIVSKDNTIKYKFLEGYGNWLLDSNIYYIDTLDDIMESEVWLNYMKNYTHCITCIQEEIAGIDFTLKDWWNQEINPPRKKIEHLELALDYTCNMMCRMCGPRQSSKWNGSDILKQMKTTLEPGDTMYDKNKGSKKYTERLKWVLGNTNFEDLKTVKLVGGEPLYSKSLKWFIDMLPNKEKIEITIVTNGSLLPDEELFKHFKKVKLEVSVDAIGDVGTTSRMKVPFETVEKNLRILNERRKYKPWYHIGVHTTVSLLNINKLYELAEWCINLGVDQNYGMLHGPKWLRITLLPKEVRQQWIQERRPNMPTWIENKLIDYLSLDQDEQPLEVYYFLKGIHQTDTEASIPFKEANPEIYNIMNNLYEEYKKDFKLKPFHKAP